MNRLESIKVYATHHESAHEPDDKKVWTISENPCSEGWETDSGYDGYGISKNKSEYYAKCINDYPQLLQRLERYEKVLKYLLERSIYIEGEDIGTVIREALKEE